MPHRRHFLLGAAALAALPAKAQPVKITLGTATPGGGFPVYGAAFIEGVRRVDEGRTINREAAARRRGAEGDLHGLGFRRQRRQGGGAEKEMSAMGHVMSVAVVAAVDFDRDVAQPRKVGQAHLVVVDRQRRI